ncbi:F228B protein, partial [Centropus bengalensis]|nr:F228B protein [Centropus bengalensis]
APPNESQELLAAAQHILDTENYFVKGVVSYLRHNDFLKLRKQEVLYKKWLEGVSEPLLLRIQEKMDNQSSEEIRKRREEQHSLYLDYCKKKGFVTLEYYDPSEYDPLFLTTGTDCWKVSVPALQDPLFEDTERKLMEISVIKQCETGRPCSPRELRELRRAEKPLLPLGRQQMNARERVKVPPAYIASEVHRT